MTGKILEARFIPGHVDMDVSLDPVNITGGEPEGPQNENQTDHQLEAHDPTGFQFLQCRGLFVLQTAVGKIAVLPIGMAQVSSVVFVRPSSEELIRLSREEQKGLSYDEHVRLINARIQAELVGRTVKKWDMITSFLFGGSDLLTLFERQTNIKILAEIGSHYPVRSAIGLANIETLVF